MLFNTTLRAFWGAVFALLLLLGQGCELEIAPRPHAESGWIPAPEGERWVEYRVEGAKAVYQGDIVFELAELREFQAGITRPHPVESSGYSYRQDGSVEGPGGPLLDGWVPEDGASSAGAWFVWSRGSDPTLVFEFDAAVEVDTVVLQARVPWLSYGPTEVTLTMGGRSITRPVSFAANVTSVQTVQIQGDALSGLDLVGERLEITPHFGSGGSWWSTARVELSEVEFQSGDPELVSRSIVGGRAWPEEIAYEISANFMSGQRQMIVDALQAWEDATEHRFVEDAGRGFRIRIKPDADAGDCYSKGLGRPILPTPRDIRLGANCFDLGTIIHEIGHALGLAHEQTRSDRPGYVEYLEGNVQPGKKDQFKGKGFPFGSYDYRSVMHYRNTSWGRRLCCSAPIATGDDTGGGMPAGCGTFDSLAMDTDGDGQVDACPAAQPTREVLQTLIPLRDLPPGVEIGQTQEISKTDAAAVNALFHDQLKTRSYNALSDLRFEGLDLSQAQVENGDVNGDGLQDLVIFDQRRADVWVALGREGDALEPLALWNGSFCAGTDTCRIADLNGDGRDDAVAFRSSVGDVITGLSSGHSFDVVSGAYVVHPTLGSYAPDYAVGNIDGDCRDDVISFRIQPWDSGVTTVYLKVAFSAPGWSGESVQTQPVFHGLVMKPIVGDVDGDFSDEVVIATSEGDVFVLFWEGQSWRVELWFQGTAQLGTLKLADMNGDGRPDLVSLREQEAHALDRVRVYLSNGYEFLEQVQYHELDCRNESATACLSADFTGDGIADLIDPVVFDRPKVGRNVGDVYVSRSTDFWTPALSSVKPLPSPWARWQHDLCNQPGVAY